VTRAVLRCALLGASLARESRGERRAAHNGAQTAAGASLAHVGELVAAIGASGAQMALRAALAPGTWFAAMVVPENKTPSRALVAEGA
jgi:hypothetical protein